MAVDKAAAVLSDGNPSEPLTEDKPSEPDSEKSDEPEWKDLLGSGSLLKKLIREGQPDSKPQRQQKCVINYKLTLATGTPVEQKDSFELTLGDYDVVQGLDVALGLMNMGERCMLKIEPRLAFGAAGLPPLVPRNAAIIYDVELLSVAPEDDPEALNLDDRRLHGNRKRERGNWWYGRGENTLAIQCYRRALDYLDETEGNAEVADSALQELLEDRISVYNNMAAAQIKLELYQVALNSLGTVLRCQPGNVKALFRKAKVHRARNELSAALRCLRKADEAEPNNGDVQKEIAAVTKLIQKQKISERELAKRMFGEQKATSKNVKSRGAKNNILMWSAGLAASFAIGLVGVAAYRLKFA